VTELETAAAWWQQVLLGLMSGGWSHQWKKHRKRGWKVVLQEEKAQMSQPDIRGQTVSNPSEVWGDAMLRKGPHICQIGLLNPTGFTVHGGSAKDNQKREFIGKVNLIL